MTAPEQESDIWWNAAQVLFDLETGGTDPDADEIVTGTAILVPQRPPGGGPRPPKVYEYLLAPERDIPAAATAVHGITTEYAREHGKPPAETIERMTSMLEVLLGSGATLIGMNVSFDLTFLDRACLYYGLRPLTDRLSPGELRVVDVYVIDKEMSRRKGKRNLGALCAHYGVEIGQNAHDSTVDCLAAGRVAWAQCRDYLKIREAKIEDLHEWQVGWRAKQSKSFASWLRGQAAQQTDLQERQRMLADADAIRPEWPLVPRLVPVPEPEPEERLW